MEEDRILGAVLDEVLYADDTIIHSTNPKRVEQLLHKIEQEGATYGLKLNKKKCETMNVRGASGIYFGGGEQVNEMNESKYLGCFLNNKTKSKRGLNKRKGDVFTTWKNLKNSGKTATVACNANL